MSQYHGRVADQIVTRALTTFGAVVIEGPRGSGKTTTGLAHSASFVRVDSSPAIRTMAEAAPEVVLMGETPRLIDEWQFAPALWNAVRHTVDERRTAGQFILTGSATPADDVTHHSGAGRFRRIILRPMSLAESGDSTGAVSFVELLAGSKIAAMGGATVPEYVRLIIRGGWPALVAEPERSPSEYLRSYLADVTRVDLALAGHRVDPARMGALLYAIARNTATEAPAARLAGEAELGSVDDVAMSAQTARKYLDALTRIHVLEEQPAWAVHLRSAIRTRVSPKWHFVDPSLAAAALGGTTETLLADPQTLGFLFESLTVRDLRIYADAVGGLVTHYRDEKGHEVDVVVEFPDGRWAAFEVKLGGEAAVDAGAAALQALAAKVTDQRRERLISLSVITAGNLSYTRPDGVNVVALGHLAP
ncbi:MAG: DUF4143 domain-containing protein [Promicromonosporaceae bacterium]|nr:DUF4143 domain-containing protein [Promicromonosporaceae bacterium]